jgi:hypothetical protein
MGYAKRLLGAASVAFVCSIGASSASTNLLTNGSFETGNFTGWTQFGNTGGTSVRGKFIGIAPENGSFQAAFGPHGSTGGISQTFTDNPGETYDFSIWYYSFGGSPSSQLIQVDSNIYFNQNPVAATSAYTEITGTFVGTGSDTVRITEQNNPSFQLIDNAFVGASPQTVPEPSTWAMMLLGFAGLGYLGYRGRRSTVAAAT